MAELDSETGTVSPNSMLACTNKGFRKVDVGLTGYNNEKELLIKESNTQSDKQHYISASLPTS